MAYQPPHKKTETVEDKNFPPLGNSVAKTWTGRKFSELAQEWKAAKEESDFIDKVKKAEDETPAFVLPKFRNVKHYVEREKEVENKPTDGWTTVNSRRIRREKVVNLDEKYPEPPDESVWSNDKGDHETCWDDR